MKKTILLLAVLCLVFSHVRGQHAYFWNLENQQVALTEQRHSLCLYFHEAKFAKEFSYLNHPGIKYIKANNQLAKKRVIFEFNQGYDLTPMEMLEELGIQRSEVKSAHWGMKHKEGMKMWLTHRVLFEKNSDVELQELEQIWFEYSGASYGVSRTGMEYVDITDIHAVLPLANRLYESGKVQWAQPNFAVVVKSQSMSSTPVTPTDPLYPKLYYLNNTGQNPLADLGFWSGGTADVDINAPEAWCTTLGSSSIKVAVVDQGVEAHEDLNDDNGGGGSRIVGGYTSDPTLPNSGGVPQLQPGAHGQSVAGVIAASHNSVGVSGVCPECEILAVTAFDQADNITTTDATEIQYLADAINWAYLNGADVINNSWILDATTSSALFAPIETAIDKAKSLGRGGKGCIVVFSAGQEIGVAPYDSVAYPASLSQVIAVGAIDMDGTDTPYANYGPELDIVAPTSRSTGESNISVMDRMGTGGYNTTVITPGSEHLYYSNTAYFRYFGGTSVSAAEVSGVAALVLSYNPNLTATEVTNLLLANTRDYGPAGFDNTFGNGMLRADAVLAATPAPGLPVEYLSFTGEARLQKIELNWETVLEINNDYFLVEKEFDGLFRPIGRVEGIGNTQEGQSYTFLDLAPNFGSNVYRLRQVDFDGTVDYSHSIEVSMDPDNIAIINKLYPNPTRDQLSLEIVDMARKNIFISVLDMQGRALQSKHYEIGSQVETLHLDVSKLSAGSYLLRLRSSGAGQEIRKFVITD